jgi:hypothetical protein
VTAPHAAIRSFFLHGPAGRLEALLNEGRDDASHVALVCHPHPLFGGTMHNKVVFHATKALHGFGFPVLRFNFRGTGLSDGTHDGRAEVEDVRAAVDWLSSEFGKPVVFAGFSFGCATGLRACHDDARVPAMIGLGIPIAADGRLYEYKYLRPCTKPKLFISGDRDEFGPRAEVEQVIAQLAEPKKLVWVEDADHFLAGATPAASQLPKMREAIEQWLPSALGTE